MLKKISCPHCNSFSELVSETNLSCSYFCNRCKKFTDVDKPLATKEVLPPIKTIILNKAEEGSLVREGAYQPTSAKAYEDVVSSGLAGVQKEKVFRTVVENPNVSICEIGLIANLEKSSVCARLDELRKEKRVVHTGWKKIFDGGLGRDKEVMVWGVALRL